MSDLVLVADDQPEVREWLSDVLRRNGRIPVALGDAALVASRVAELGPDLGLVILDLDFGAGRTDGMTALKALRGEGHDVPVLILTGKGSVKAAVEALRAGATDFLEKDAHVEDTLAAALARVDRYSRVVAENRRLRARLDGSRELVARSPVAARLLETIARLGPVPRPVLVVGERGTGKELIAHALHRRSPRAGGPFVTLNCAAIAEGLLECELFGQEANAFNGAPFKEGRFDMANHGSLFLDEIGNMGDEFQRKILRVIEYQSFERVQGTSTIHVDVRIIAATNADLQSAMAAGRFRPDLYDRLAFDVIRVPPLRERPEDIEPLAQHFAAMFHREVAGVPLLEFTPEAVSALSRYAWPGNVRELKNLVERLATRLDEPTVSARAVIECLPEAQPLAAGMATRSAQDPGAPLVPFEEQVAGFERRLLTDALNRAGGNRRRAAEALDLSYDQLRRLLAKHDIA